MTSLGDSCPVKSQPALFGWTPHLSWISALWSGAAGLSWEVACDVQSEWEAKATFCKRWFKPRGFAFWLQLSHCRRVVLTGHEAENCSEGAQEQIPAQISQGRLPKQLLALGQTRQCVTGASGWVLWSQEGASRTGARKMSPSFSSSPLRTACIHVIYVTLDFSSCLLHREPHGFFVCLGACLSTLFLLLTAVLVEVLSGKKRGQWGRQPWGRGVMLCGASVSSWAWAGNSHRRSAPQWKMQRQGSVLMGQEPNRLKMFGAFLQGLERGKNLPPPSLAATTGEKKLVTQVEENESWERWKQVLGWRGIQSLLCKSLIAIGNMQSSANGKERSTGVCQRLVPISLVAFCGTLGKNGARKRNRSSASLCRSAASTQAGKNSPTPSGQKRFLCERGSCRLCCWKHILK